MSVWKWAGMAAMVAVGGLVLSSPVMAANLNLQLGAAGAGGVQLSMAPPDNPEALSGLIQVLMLLTVIAVAPGILILCTSFTRILIVLSFLRQALGINHIPPNQVLIAIALFLTAFNMRPVWQEIQTQVIEPYRSGTLAWQDVARAGSQPIRKFLLRHTRPKDLGLFLKLSRDPKPQGPQDVSLLTLVPAFVISELRVAFQIGFLLYLPFLVVDMVVASILLSMGMMMLPPIMVSLPFKILLFVMVDGWNLLVSSLMRSFY